MTKRIDNIARRIKRLRSFAIEEIRTAHLYHKLGYHSQANDESSHSLFFEKEAKRLARSI